MDFCVVLSRENEDKTENMPLAQVLLMLRFTNNVISCQQREQKKCMLLDIMLCLIWWI